MNCAVCFSLNKVEQNISQDNNNNVDELRTNSSVNTTNDN